MRYSDFEKRKLNVEDGKKGKKKNRQQLNIYTTYSTEIFKNYIMMHFLKAIVLLPLYLQCQTGNWIAVLIIMLQIKYEESKNTLLRGSTNLESVKKYKIKGYFLKGSIHFVKIYYTHIRCSIL